MNLENFKLRKLFFLASSLTPPRTPSHSAGSCPQVLEENAKVSGVLGTGRTKRQQNSELRGNPSSGRQNKVDDQSHVAEQAKQ